MFLDLLKSWELHILEEYFSLLMWPVLVLQLNFEFWDIILVSPSIELPFYLFWVTLKYNFNTIVMYYILYKLCISFH